MDIFRSRAQTVLPAVQPELTAEVQGPGWRRGRGGRQDQTGLGQTAIFFRFGLWFTEAPNKGPLHLRGAIRANPRRN